jgi:hypothetical protein
MICKECRTAGDRNAVGLYEEAAEHHELCDGEGQCDCQHKTGAGWINSERIRTEG